MKRAVVISGGGSKGAFAVGALQHLLLDRGLAFDFVSGTSTGALMAPLVVTGDLAELRQIYTSVTTDDILRRRDVSDVIRANSIFETGPLESIIRQKLTATRVARILASPVQMVVTTVCLQTGNVTYFHTRPTLAAKEADAIRLQDREAVIQAVLASSNQPVFMRPVPIPPAGTPMRQYVDGGVREIAPLRVAIDNGATDVYAIILSPEKRTPDEKHFRDIPGILIRTIGLFTDDVVLNDVETARLCNDAVLYLNALRRRIGDRFSLDGTALDDLFEITGQANPFKGKNVLTLRVIRPKEKLPTEGLEFDPGKMALMMDVGRRRAEDVLGA